LYDWSKYFKLGCVQYASYPNTKDSELLEAVKCLASDSLFEVIELTRISDPRLRAEVRNVLKAAEVDIIFSGGPVYLAENIELGSLDKSVRELSLKKAKQLVDEAIELGAMGHLVASGRDPGPSNRSSACLFLAESLLELTDYIKTNSPKTMMLTIEPFDREIAHKALIGPTEKAVDLVNEVRKHTDNFGITMDLSHLMQLGEHPSTAVELAAKFISHIHLANCYLGDTSHPSYGDQHVRFGFPESMVDEKTVASFLKALSNSGVFGHGKRLPLSLEVKPQQGENPDMVIAAAKRSFLRAWQLFINN
jgi:sugar phosphate isomerase/epimerase